MVALALVGCTQAPSGDPGQVEATGAPLAIPALGLHATSEGSLRAAGPTWQVTVTPRADRATWSEKGQRLQTPAGDWIAATPRGLQHGFVVHDATDALALPVRIEGLHPVVLPDGRAAALVDAAGRTRARYQGLHAWDADDRPLRAWMTTDAAGLVLHVDTRRATFPVTVDPWLVGEQQAIAPAAPTGADLFGFAVDMTDDLLVVGAPEAGAAGAAYVYERDFPSTGAWGLRATLTPVTDPLTADARYGTAVAIDGDQVVVGAPDQGAGGAVFAFRQDQGGTDAWGQIGPTIAEVTSADFGFAVDLSGEIVVVGDPALGAAWIYEQNFPSLDAFTQRQDLSGPALSDPSPPAGFGTSVAVDGSTALVGASGSDPGAVYVFDRHLPTSNNWGQRAKLIGDGDDTAFGATVALDGHTAAMSSQDGVGRVFLHERHLSGTHAWGLRTVLAADTATSGDAVGAGLALFGDTLLAGAPGSTDGAAHLFRRDEGGTDAWGEGQHLLADSPVADSLYGAATAISASRVAVGAPGDVDGKVLLYTPQQPPVLVNNTGLALDEGATAVIGRGSLRTDDPDTAADELVYLLLDAPDDGVLKANGVTLGASDVFTQEQIDDGLLTYTHGGADLPANLTDAFQFQVSDGTGYQLVAASFAITVQTVPDPPQITANTGIAVNEGQTGSLGGLTVSDPDTAASGLTVQVLSGPAHGTLSLTSFTLAALGTVTYTHDGSETTTDSFGFTVSDGSTTVASTFPIAVTPVPDPPVPTVGTLTVAEGGSTTVSSAHLGASDADTAPASLLWTVTAAASSGAFENLGTPVTSFTHADLLAGKITFRHGGSEPAADSAALTLGDGTTTTSAQTLTLTVTPVDDPPVLATNAGLTVAEGSADTALGTSVLSATDVDTAAASLLYRVAVAPTHGTLKAGGTPLAAGGTFSQAQIAAGQVTYSHDGSEGPTDAFTFTLQGSSASPATFTFTITPDDDPPTPVVGSLTVAEGGAATVTGGALSATDVDTASSSLVWKVTTPAAHGTFKLSGSNATTFTQGQVAQGLVTFHHDGDEGTSDSAVLSLEDGETVQTGFTLSITVTPADDPPTLDVLTGRSAAEGSTGTAINHTMLSASDVDTTDANLTFTLQAVPVHGTLRSGTSALAVSGQFTQATLTGGTLTYDHDGSETASDSFRVLLSDGTTTLGPFDFPLTITPANDAPSLATNATLQVAEGEATDVLSTTFWATDPDGDALTVTVQSGPARGTLRYRCDACAAADLSTWQAMPGDRATFPLQHLAEGRVRYEHDGSEASSDSFALAVADADTSIGPYTVQINIDPRNDSPTLLASGPLQVDEADTASLQAALAASDADDVADDLTFEVDLEPLHGVIEVDGSPDSQFTQGDLSAGLVTYTHDGSETTADFLLYTVRDPAGAEVAGRLDVQIAPQNDAPSIGLNTGLSLDEGGDIVLSAAHLRIDDEDDDATHLTLRLTGAPANGSLRLDGASLGPGDPFTQQQINEARVVYRHNGSETTTDTLPFNARDAAGATLNGSIAVQITPSNDPPLVTNSVGLSLAEGETKVIPPERLRVTDADDGPAALVYTVTTAPDHGTLVVDGATIGQGGQFDQADVESLLLAYAHGGGQQSSDRFRVTVADPLGASVSLEFALAISTTNDAPTQAGSLAITVDEGSFTVISPLALRALDEEDPASALTYTVLALALRGTLVLDGAPLTIGDDFTQQQVDEARVAYVHNGSEQTSDTFTVRVEDANGTGLASQVAVTVTPVDDAPVILRNDPLQVAEGETAQVDAALQSQDADDGSADLTYTVVDPPQFGVLRLDADPLAADDTFTQADLDDGLVTYAHDGGETTEDSFDFRVADDTTTRQDTLTIEIDPRNDAPTVVASLGVTVQEGSAALIDSTRLAATDADDGPSDLTWTLTDAPDAGTLSMGGTPLSAGATFTQTQVALSLLVYTHGGGETANDAFTLDLTDPDGAGEVGVPFPITITPLNDAPVITANTGLTVLEAGSQTIGPLALSATDTDDLPEDLAYVLKGLPTAGELTLSGTPLGLDDTFTQADLVAGTVAYTHDGDETTADAFAFVLTDGQASLPQAPFAIAITPQNDLPVLVTNEPLALLESTSASISASLLQAVDVDNTPAQLVFTVGTSTTNGTLARLGVQVSDGGTFTQADIDAGRLAYTHSGTETTSDAFTFVVSDGTDALAQATFTIAVDDQNDPPVVVLNEAVEVEEGGTVAIPATALRIVDPDHGPSSLTLTVQTAPEHGDLLLDGSPIGATGTFTQADIDDGKLAYRHNGDEAEADSFVFTASDGAGGTLPATTFHLHIGPLNDPPWIEVEETLVVVEGGSAALSDEVLLVLDTDNGPTELILTLTTLPAHGTLKAYGSPLELGETFSQAEINGGFVSYTHDGGESTEDSFGYEVSDGGESPLPASTLPIEVQPANDRPVAVDDGPYQLVEDGVLVVDADGGLLANDTDIDSADLEVILSHGVVNGTLEIQPDGGFTYTPYPGFSGSDRFTYMAFDGAAPSNVASVILMVAAAPDTGIDDTGDEEPPKGCGNSDTSDVGHLSLGVWLLVLLGFRRRRQP